MPSVLRTARCSWSSLSETAWKVGTVPLIRVSRIRYELPSQVIRPSASTPQTAPITLSRMVGLAVAAPPVAPLGEQRGPGASTHGAQSSREEEAARVVRGNAGLLQSVTIGGARPRPVRRGRGSAVSAPYAAAGPAVTRPRERLGRWADRMARDARTFVEGTHALTEQLRLMAVHAHPDDESSKGAATMAMYVDQGVDVLVATCTGGERGSVLNPKLQGKPEIEENIHEVRRKEMDEARAILGVKQAWLGFVDSGLPEGDPLPPLPEGCFGLQDVKEAAEPLVRLIREFKPQVITTYDENGGYPHPDHIMTHKITMVAFDAAGDPDAYPEAGEPWQPLKLYYNHGFPMGRIRALHKYLSENGHDSPYGEWIMRLGEERPHGARDHHPGPLRRLVRDPGPRADRARHPDRPGRPVVPRPAGGPARGVAHRGLRARPYPGRRGPAGGRPVRRSAYPQPDGRVGRHAGLKHPRRPGSP